MEICFDPLKRVADQATTIHPQCANLFVYVVISNTSDDIRIVGKKDNWKAQIEIALSLKYLIPGIFRVKSTNGQNVDIYFGHFWPI